MSRTTFYGFGAYVGSLRGLTECAWWDDDPVRVYNWAQGALVPVDLAKNPMAYRAGRIGLKDIQVDDHRQDGGLTTIGPMFPTGAVIGQCWLSQQYYDSLPNKPPRQPASAPDDGYDYESTCYLFTDGEEGNRRFYGFHARIADINGPLSQVEIWQGGTGKIKNRGPQGVWWLDLKAVALPPGPDATQIVARQDVGALFLDAATTHSLALLGPKKPPYMGEHDYP